jgi:hypothetical protein
MTLIVLFYTSPLYLAMTAKIMRGFESLVSTSYMEKGGLYSENICNFYTCLVLCWVFKSNGSWQEWHVIWMRETNASEFCCEKLMKGWYYKTKMTLKLLKNFIHGAWSWMWLTCVLSNIQSICGVIHVYHSWMTGSYFKYRCNRFEFLAWKPAYTTESLHG